MGKVITLLTDFGLKDSYVSEMKGVIYSLLPDVAIVDISHEVRQGDISSASFLLLRAYRYFPRGTVHLVVVDPGVGTSRGVLCCRTENYYFIGPDNGVLAPAAENDNLKYIFSLNLEELPVALKEVFSGSFILEKIKTPSSTFHGRDIFAPFACYVSTGSPITRLAVKKERMVATSLPKPVLTEGGVKGHIIYVDRFGNLVTNINVSLIEKDSEVFLKSGYQVISFGKLKRAYAEVKQGEPLALIGSFGTLEIAVNGGNASEKLNATVGDEVLVMKK